MWLNNAVRTLVIVGALWVLAACGGSDRSDSANYVPIPTPPAPSSSIAGSPNASEARLLDDQVVGNTPTVIVTAAESAQASNVSIDEFQTLESAFDRYLAIRSSVIVGEADIDELNAVATSGARSQVSALRDRNDAYVASEAIIAMTDLMEWSNFTTPTTDGDRVTFTDCTERQYITRLGARRITFATNDVVMVADGDGYLVESVIERQNGAFATVVGERGCVPTSFAQRADNAVATAIADLATMVADPANATDAPASFATDLQPAITEMVEGLATQGMRRVSDETYELSVVGMDLGKREFTVIVAMCTHYPTGYYFVDDASGRRTAPEIRPGANEFSLVYVQLNPGVGAETGDVVAAIEPQTTDCPGA